MEPARALADLVEISPQIEAAAVFAGDGEPLDSVGVSDTGAAALTSVGRALLAAADELRRAESRATRLHASLDGGDVFAVAGTGEKAIVALTSERPAPGLVFYDLKRCLAALDHEADGDA